MSSFAGSIDGRGISSKLSYLPSLVAFLNGVDSASAQAMRLAVAFSAAGGIEGSAAGRGLDRSEHLLEQPLQRVDLPDGEVAKQRRLRR